jgi:hypothetical protein
MVYNYDIYYLLSPRGGQSYRVTNSAVPGIVSNGVTDWLYEGNYFIQENSYINTILSLPEEQLPKLNKVKKQYNILFVNQYYLMANSQKK